MATNQVTRRVGLLLILRENGETPSDAEWDETIRLLTINPAEVKDMKVLVVTDGGGPNAGQRRRLAAALKNTNVRVAVMSESIKVRFIVSSVALLTARIKSFTMKERAGAYAHLGLSQEERAAADKNLREMTAELQGAAVPATA